MKPYIVTFIGNKEVSDSEQVLKTLVNFLEEHFACEYPPTSAYPVFYCGGYGQFGQIASEAIDLLRKRHPELKSEKLFVTPYINPSYQETLKYVKDFYDGIIYPPLENVPPKFAIDRRNKWMIDECDMFIVCMQYTYGNTKKYVDYALRQNKLILYIGIGEVHGTINFLLKERRGSL